MGRQKAYAMQDCSATQADCDAYDPRKREYIRPASQEEQAAAHAKLLTQQAECLRSVLGRRSHALDESSDVIKHYENVLADTLVALRAAQQHVQKEASMCETSHLQGRGRSRALSQLLPRHADDFEVMSDCSHGDDLDVMSDHSTSFLDHQLQQCPSDLADELITVTTKSSSAHSTKFLPKHDVSSLSPRSTVSSWDTTDCSPEPSTSCSDFGNEEVYHSEEVADEVGEETASKSVQDALCLREQSATSFEPGIELSEIPEDALDELLEGRLCKSARPAMSPPRHSLLSLTPTSTPSSLKPCFFVPDQNATSQDPGIDLSRLPDKVLEELLDGIASRSTRLCR
jgi:hypothetical protein